MRPRGEAASLALLNEAAPFVLEQRLEAAQDRYREDPRRHLAR